ncbi:p21-C-terminal region-binding protein-domain-containing protein [Coemansia spiralis]|nr:p21-C-terminal region-binding protein-domain-containing protein [Coemansia spiralis]
MSQKRAHDAEMHSASDTSDASDASSINSTVDVDFEFFAPHPTDFHSIKRLLQTSFGDDSEDFDLSELTDLILEQATIGSTVKTDGEEGDPLALLTVLDLTTAHRDTKVVEQITEYLIKKAGAQMKDQVAQILGGRAGLLVSERIINIPPHVVAPMLRMLTDEMKTAELCDFEHYVLICPMYTETAAIEEDSDDESNKKKPLVTVRRNKNAAAKTSEQPSYLHPEDEFIEEFACLKFDYKFTRSKRAAESRNSFTDTGLAPSRRCLVIHKSNLSQLVDRLNDVLAP